MPSKYNPQKIEKKWQKAWEQKRLYHASDTSKKKKYYALIEFPYPSGDGLHVGHVRSYTAMDIVARKRRMQGHNVLYPIGWDAFGLPTENYAIKTGIHPKIVTRRNTDTFRRQLQSLGFSFDWSREINTTDPAYYKWTQWIFLKLFDAGLAYKARTTINWCPKDKIGLANEEVVGGMCERCGTAVEKREKEQWMLKITAYAEKLLKGLGNVDYIPEARVQQENWIGRSEGAEIVFALANIPGQPDGAHKVTVFTTRPDTLFGATFLVVSPELAQSWLDVGWQASANVREYVKESTARRASERDDAEKEKTGVASGIFAINPATQEKIPVWIADYVLAGYGTGAIMAVPAHDQRDFEFAKKFDLPTQMVVCPHYPAKTCPVLDTAYEGVGHLVGSASFDGMPSEEAKSAIAAFVGAKTKVQYKLRDWIFSRQRYWGEPIPLVYCETCAHIKKFKSTGERMNPGWIPVREKDLPVKLPTVRNYKPTDTGESPLASMASWMRVKCPRCGGAARRETDVMPNWAGSSWYFLRYADPKNKKAFADRAKLKRWTPVDWYNGGMEHTVLHLLYSRFWSQFLYDKKLVPVREPYNKRTSHGLILGEGGEKMSKSRGNVVNPDMLVHEFGADALRLYEMFIGPFNQAAAWDPRGIVGLRRFLDRVWAIAHEKEITKGGDDKELTQLLHRTIKKVGDDIEAMAFNTAVSALMICSNACAERERIPRTMWEQFLLILAPFAPHMTEELWAKLGNRTSIHATAWPKFDAKKVRAETFSLVLQVNGKVRDVMEVPVGISQKEAQELAYGREHIAAYMKGAQPRKVIFVPNRLLNIVI